MLYAFDSRLAERYGVDEAIFLHNLCFWVTKNQQDGRNFHDGYTWIYHSIEAFCEFFPFWSSSQIRRLIRKLQDKGAIHIGNYNAAPYDRTYWYTPDESVLSLYQNRRINASESTLQSDEIGAPIPDSKTNRKTDSKNTADPKTKNERRKSYEFSAETAGGDQAAGGDSADRPLFL